MPPDVSSNRDKQSLHFIIRSGLAGGVAGCVAKTVVAPLDRVKILFQASNPDFQKYAGTWSGAFRAGAEIYKQNGVRGLFQGHSATLLRVFPYAAIKFMAYDQVHYFLMPTRESETNLRRFAAGSISGTISVFFTYPLELIRVRMAFQTRSLSTPKDKIIPRNSLTQAISDIYKEGSRSSVEQNGGNLSATTRPHLFQRFPLLSFYRGFVVTIIGMIPYAGTSFLCWGYLRQLLLPPPPRHKPTPLYDLGIGAVSGSIAQTVSYPFEVVRRRMQVGGLTHPNRWLGFREAVGSVLAKNGWKGFYVGLSIGYLKVVPMTAVSFAVWEGGKRLPIV
ncbi:mitochondrial carrier [Rickenella mellea]|uniref:Mitochondrial carrier n=1 Tax=Rickenella mellea TaxID=50990 RepID=A0A4Y7PXS7_9AGAM|nr:mitochondrial carrier [Rickenella mellea]